MKRHFITLLLLLGGVTGAVAGRFSFPFEAKMVDSRGVLFLSVSEEKWAAGVIKVRRAGKEPVFLEFEGRVSGKVESTSQELAFRATLRHRDGRIRVSFSREYVQLNEHEYVLLDRFMGRTSGPSALGRRSRTIRLEEDRGHLILD